MDISKIRYTDEVELDYSTGAGEFRIKSTEDPSPDLTNAIFKLHPLFVRRMQMESVMARLWITGADFGNDDMGDWVRISGKYRAHTVDYKLTTAKIHKPTDMDGFWEKREYDAWPAYLTKDEYNLILNLQVECVEFVNGKRSQKELDFEEQRKKDIQSDELSFYDDDDEVYDLREEA